MKLAPPQIAASLRDTSAFAGFLIYGEDIGLTRERSLLAVSNALGHGASAFQLATLTREEHGRLRSEVSSRSLGGGRRVIHVQDAADGLVATLDKLVIDPADTLVVLQAGELQSRSKLRAYAEKHPTWGAIACYIGNESTVMREVQASLTTAGVAATPDALAYLSQELAGESSTRRSELMKLALFAHGETIVDLPMVQQCCSVSLDTSLADAVTAALSGRSTATDALLAELAREGATGAGILAVLSNQMQRLLKIRLLIDSGQSAAEACRSLSPPLYPRQSAAFLRDVKRWRTPALEALGRAIREADLACKRAASPDFAIAARLLASVAARAEAN